MEPTAISDANGLICRGELYRTAFAAAGIPLYDATLYGLDWLSPSENTLRVGKELGLCAENKTAAELVTRAEAAQLLHAVLPQTLTVTPPDTPIVVENLTQWNVNAFLLELCKVPQPILDAFNENGWTFVIGTEYLTALSRKLGVNCIGAAAYTEKRIYVFEASAILHEFGHFLDCTMGFPQEHTIDDIGRWASEYWSYSGRIGLAESAWLTNHLTLRLFQLGRLQFCMEPADFSAPSFGIEPGQPLVSVHICRGGSLEPAACDASFAQARAFFPKYFPAYAFSYFSCHSWLLDETLLPLVGVYSNISFFQQRFQIVGRTASNAAARYVLRWDIQPDEIAAFVPQNRFQALLKERLLAGQQFYEATGLIAR